MATGTRSVMTLVSVASVALFKDATAFAAASTPGTIDVNDVIYLTGVSCYDATSTARVIEIWEWNGIGAYQLVDKFRCAADGSAQLEITGPPPVRIIAAKLRLVVTPTPVTATDMHVTAYYVPLRFVAPETL